MPEFSAQLRVDAQQPFFDGHFPGQPIVPAVWLLDQLGQMLNEELQGSRVSGVPSAKFLSPVPPGESLTFTVNADPASGRARFRIEASGRLAAQGELRFSTAPV
jgi:3-hydroxymyristoyl/3-hydroxydecanoyl-(acyl carrier protein) dehydratase